MTLRQHSKEVMVEVLTVVRQEMPADGESKANNKGHNRRQEAASDMQRLSWSG